MLPRLMRNTVSLVTVLTSTAPSNGIDSRGWRLKPSNVLMTSRSSQSEGWTSQSGSGKATRRPVLWLPSLTVNQSLGKGPPDGWSRLKRALTPAAQTSDGPISSMNSANEIRYFALDVMKHVLFRDIKSLLFYPSHAWPG